MNSQLPSFNNLTPIDSLAKDLQVLNQQTNLSTNERWQAYRQIFQSYFTHKRTFPDEHMSTSSTTENNVPAGLSESQKQIVQTSLPRYLSARGQALLALVHKRFRENSVGVSPSSGELYVNGMPVSESNFFDIISYALRGKSKRASVPPPGWDFFNRLIPPTDYAQGRPGSSSSYPIKSTPAAASAKIPTDSSPISAHLRKRARGADGPIVTWSSYDEI